MSHPIHVPARPGLRPSLVSALLAVLSAAPAAPGQSLFITSDGTDSVIEYSAIDGSLVGTFVPGGSGGLEQPRSIRIGNDDNFYVASNLTDQVLEYDGVSGTFVGAFVTAGQNGLAFPWALAFRPQPAGNLFVNSSTGPCVIQYHGLSGATIGNFVCNPGGDFQYQGLTFGLSGNIFVASTFSNRVREYDPTTGMLIRTYLGLLNTPRGMTVRANGNLLVANVFGDNVVRFDTTNGNSLGVFVAAGSGGLDAPQDLAHGPDGRLYVTSAGTHNVLRYDAGTGAFIDEFVTAGSGGLSSPVGLVFKKKVSTSGLDFSHAPGTAGLAPPPANAVFAAPDAGDVFTSSTPVDSPSFTNYGNALLLDGIGDLGLMAGDDVDALHQGNYAAGPGVHFAPRLYFSVRDGSLGAASSAVSFAAPLNQADVFFSPGTGGNLFSVREVQPGLVEAGNDGLDALRVRQSPDRPCVYFSLAPGSPSLAALGASAADVLGVVPGPGAAPVVAIPAADLGLDALTDDLDGLVLVGGDDLDGDCAFDPTFEPFPLVLFSVRDGATGLAGTGVASETPNGAHVFAAAAPGGNTVFATPAQLGLLAADDIDALEVNLTIGPEGFHLPFHDPAPPPPFPTGPSCDIGGVKISLCEQFTKPPQVKFCTLNVVVVCPGAGGKFKFGPFVFPVICDGNPLLELLAVQAVLLGLTCPWDGLPVFCTVTGPFIGPPNRGQLCATVNPATVCKVQSISWKGAMGCITKDMICLAFQGGDLSGVIQAELSVVGGQNQGGPAQFVFDPVNEPPVFINIPPGQTVGGFLANLQATLTAMGYSAAVDGGALQIQSIPSGGGLTGLELFGFLIGDPGPGWTVGLELGVPSDCNANGVPDDEDIAGGTSQDDNANGIPDECECRGDIDASGSVGFADLTLLLNAWGPCNGCIQDLDGNGAVGFADLSELLNNWGPC